MHDKVSTSLDFEAREHSVLDFWRENRIFEKSIENREGCPNFTFYDGPPTANGKPHIGHVLTRAMKDIIPRYRTMKGYRVLRKAGWDTHGLPVELEVEKALGLDGKPQIEQYGIEPFIAECKQSVWKYKTDWERMSERVGYWADMEHPYVTYENAYIESVWWALKQMFDRGLLYKGHKVVPYCPRCGTALSSHEVAQGYADVTDTSAYVCFAVTGQPDTYLMAWTTTPWTLPSNVALVVNAAEDYVYAAKEGRTLILARALADAVLGEGAYEVVRTVKGQELVGLAYDRLYPYAGDVREKGWYVVADDYVTLTDGTGIVHTAPAFGEDDARVGRAYGLPFVQMVDTQGRFVPEAVDFAGLFVKDADPKILEDLERRGLLFKAADYEHSYPFCWRCDTPLIYYARATWFIRMTEVRDRLIANNRSINWLPENIKEGRMGNFLENVVDWGVSRERYWGTPLPIWECECGHRHTIGSIAELKERGENVPEDIELHKPFIDRITIGCDRCGGRMKRVPEVIDCWFDAGSMPFAQWHYPFENRQKFEENFPANFISEAIDQTRGWFYTLLAISTVLFDRAPFENCIVLGHVQDRDGIKMSKHKHNVVDPWDALGKQGADAVRWYFYTNSNPWLPSRYFDEAVSEAQRKFMGTLWNTYAFYVLYANIDGFDATKHALDPDALTLMDRWILSRLHTLIGTVDEYLDAYRVTEPGRALADFVDDLSNWYVRRCRERFWAPGEEPDKVAAYRTLYEVLVTVAKLAAPFTPFMSEQMYRNLVCGLDAKAPESVHLCDFPVRDASMIDAELETTMAQVLRVVALGRACRNEAVIKNRQPLAQLIVAGMEPLSAQGCAIIAEELNVKAVDFVQDARAFTTYRIKPQLKTLGPRYGKILPKIGAALAEVDGNAFVDALDQDGVWRATIADVDVELKREDALIEPMQKPGYMAQQERELTVVIDTTLTEALIDEGFAREIVSKIQTQRKEAGFEVTDRIRVWLTPSERLRAVVAASGAAIAADVLAVSFEVGDAPEGAYAKDWNINGESCAIAVRKAEEA